MVFRYFIFLFFIILITVISSCSEDTEETNPAPNDSTQVGNIIIDRVFENLIFNQPVLITNAGDGSDRLFVVERQGRILSFSNTESVDETVTFLDISNAVRTNGLEEGLLGLTFHPDFTQNGEFFVYYTAVPNGRSVVSRFQVQGETGDVDSEEILLEIDQPFANHNAGMIEFGPDGFLYIALGDGGGAGDPIETGQDNTDLLGSILRVDVDNPSASLPYGIPADNPFSGNGDGLGDEIYAYGLRNPFRFSFDRGTGMLWLGDVGQNEVEEINIIVNGGNYGWNITEGSQCFSATSCDMEGFVDPIAEYPHSIGSSVTGGYVYRGSQFESLAGQYFYADFVTGIVFQLNANESNPAPQEFTTVEIGISSFGEDEEGELYMTDFNDGGIYGFVVQ